MKKKKRMTSGTGKKARIKAVSAAKKGVWAFFVFLAGFGFLFSQVVISDVRWQVKSRGTRVYTGINELKINLKTFRHEDARVLVFLENVSDERQHGIVLKYVLKFRIKRCNSVSGKAVWSLPFHMEEIRISGMESRSFHTVKIPKVNFTAELKRLKSNGYIAEAVGIDVMIEPRPGDDLERNFFQSLVVMRYEKE